ncbi:AI-2E family transporter [Actinotalea sp. M2MS4P-6]|uniref:AI-2E family transporter n=1 Tax=Actinotalea sp. M2MS4P-6 TaxID=2983762 RepID=UPI0021E4ED88|nr:AI-2E family transporter [Actinotalea sp. M2MS4P-6]MCV2393310.1 AI-2E family transporter [Actinotalea sp. M2MS4P-6]
MSEHDQSGGAERPHPSAQLPGGSRVIGRVAGSRRNAPTEVAPLWLRAAAAWSWRIIIVIAAVALAFYATTRVLLLFIAVFLALVFTAVLRPLVGALSRWIPRGLATTLSIILAFAVVAGLFTYIGFSVAGQWNKLGQQFSDGIQTIFDYLAASPLHLTITSADFEQWLTQAQQWVQDNSGQVASTALTSAGSVAEVFAALALAIFLTVFFLIRGTEMWTWFLNQLPASMRVPWHSGGRVAWDTFSGYTRGTFLVAASDGFLAGIALLILRVPLAAPLAVLVFIGAFIPLIGAPLAMVIAMIVALAANGPITALIVGLVIAGIGQLEGHVLQPLIMGKQVSLHPVAVALSVTAGTLVAGILGAVIAVPLVAVAWAVFARLRHVDPPITLAELDAATAGPPGEDDTDDDQDENAEDD